MRNLGRTYGFIRQSPEENPIMPRTTKSFAEALNSALVALRFIKQCSSPTFTPVAVTKLNSALRYLSTPKADTELKKIDRRRQDAVAYAGLAAGSYSAIAAELIDNAVYFLQARAGVKSGNTQPLTYEMICEPRGPDASEPLTDMLPDFDAAFLREAIKKETREFVIGGSESDQQGTESAPQKPQPVVQLRGVAQKPLVFGKKVDSLSKPRYRVVEALLEAGPDGMSKPELEKIKADAIPYLRELSKMPGWKRAIRMAGKANQHYAIVYK
jgi:hypothetical protein